MIFGIIGGQICAGRDTLASYLVSKYNFKKIDIFQEFCKLYKAGLITLNTEEKSMLAQLVAESKK